MLPGFGVSAECQSIGTSGKKQRAVARSRGLVIWPQKLLVGVYFELSFLGCGFLIHLSNRSDSPRFPSPVEEDTSKIWDTTGTVFIQGPSIVMLVWRSIMLNGSLLRVCRILRFVKKLDFAFLSLGGPSHGARVWCLGRVPKHRNHWQEVEGRGKKQRACYLAQKTLSWCIF